MPESLSRRSLFTSLAGAGLSLGAAGVAAAGEPHDRQTRALENALRTLQRAGNQLVEVAADWTPPDAPLVPGQRALLNDIIAEANTILAIANTLQSGL